MDLSTVPQLSVLSNYKYDSWHGISQRQCFAQPENRLSQFTSVSEAPHGLAGRTGICKPTACQMEFLPEEIWKRR